MDTQARAKVLVTGASGYVGGALLARLQRDGVPVRAASRRAIAMPGVENVQVPENRESVDWKPALTGCSVVVHAAARVHEMRDSGRDALEVYRRANVATTLRLAEDAISAGVKRLVFLSSIKVNGERTLPGRPFAADDPPAPLDAYGISKLEAENGLLSMASTGRIEVVIVRSVLVYGPGVRANFLALLRLVARGVPLPFGSIHNKRSLVALENLVDLLSVCIVNDQAPNRIFLVSDGEDLSTAELVRRMAAALNQRALLLPVPGVVLDSMAAIVGKRAVARRLLDSLQVDIAKTRATLGWRPVVSVDQGLEATARWFLAGHGR